MSVLVVNDDSLQQIKTVLKDSLIPTGKKKKKKNYKLYFYDFYFLFFNFQPSALMI
jgi:hypothetical protein